ncbi:MAG: tetratricopeptide repeat protein [Planctomycetota bacterium]
MKPVLAAVAAALVALLLASVALRQERQRREELERRIAVLEAERVPPETRNSPVVEIKGQVLPGVEEKPASPARPADSGAENSRLLDLEKQVARLEARVRELNRAAEGAALEGVAGIPADQLWQKAQMALQDKLTGRADALLREFLKRFPGDPHIPEALQSLGWNALMSGDTAGAAEFYGKILTEFPDSKQVPYAEFYTGMSMAESGDLEGARLHYERSVEKFSGNPYWQAAALFNLGDAYSEGGQPEVAKEYWRKVSTQFAGNEQVAKLVKAAEERLKGGDSK